MRSPFRLGRFAKARLDDFVPGELGAIDDALGRFVMLGAQPATVDGGWTSGDETKFFAHERCSPKRDALRDGYSVQKA